MAASACDNPRRMEDPRTFATQDDADPRAVALYRLATRSLAAATAQEADACDREIGAALSAMLVPDAGPALAALFDGAPSSEVYRKLWRSLASAAHERASLGRTFAMPVVVVAAAQRPESANATLPGVVGDVDALVSAMRDGRALAGNASFALANTLVTADALSYRNLGGMLAWGDGADRVEALPPAPIRVAGTVESVHLRFLVGTALAAPGADLFRERHPGAWGVPVAQALSRMLAAPGVSVLALPRAPMPLVEAAWQGVVAQREVGAQVFASNAIRAIRARVGEPSAVISVHRSDAGPRAAEVRLSLSSPLDPRSAEGFRCALAPLDRVDDVVGMLESLLADCRVGDVRRMPGVHPDRDAATGQALLFKSGEPIH
jgi:hypothetical protein